MQDYIHKAFKWIDHNRWFAFSILLSVLFSGWLLGCTPRTEGFNGSEVTRSQFELEAKETAGTLQSKQEALNKEVELLQARYEVGIANLEEQEAARAKVLGFVEMVLTQAATGTVNPLTLSAAIIPTVLTLLGGGAVLDNTRKNKEIAKRDEAIENLTYASNTRA